MPQAGWLSDKRGSFGLFGLLTPPSTLNLNHILEKTVSEQNTIRNARNYLKREWNEIIWNVRWSGLSILRNNWDKWDFPVFMTPGVGTASDFIIAPKPL